MFFRTLLRSLPSDCHNIIMYWKSCGRKVLLLPFLLKGGVFLKKSSTNRRCPFAGGCLFYMRFFLMGRITDRGHLNILIIYDNQIYFNQSKIERFLECNLIPQCAEHYTIWMVDLNLFSQGLSLWFLLMSFPQLFFKHHLIFVNSKHVFAAWRF